MDEIFGRELHIGDYVMAKPSNRGDVGLNSKAFAIVVAHDRVYNGSEYKANPCYLIENLSPVDIENKKRLEESYEKYVMCELKRKKMLQKKNNEKNKLLREASIQRGDVFLHNSYYWILLGYCNVKYDTEVNNKPCIYDKLGYTYMKLPLKKNSWDKHYMDMLQKLENTIFNLKQISFKDFKYMNRNYGDYFNKYNDIDIKTILYDVEKSIIVSNKLSTRFIEPVAHVEFIDFDYENEMSIAGIFCGKYKTGYDILTLKYLHD